MHFKGSGEWGKCCFILWFLNIHVCTSVKYMHNIHVCTRSSHRPCTHLWFRHLFPFIFSLLFLLNISTQSSQLVNVDLLGLGSHFLHHHRFLFFTSSLVLTAFGSCLSLTGLWGPTCTCTRTINVHEKTHLVGPDKLHVYSDPWTALFRAY